MSATLIIMIVAVTVTLAGTWYAWWDYRRHPDRYGYRPGERERLFTSPARGVTREPIRRWPFPPSHTLDAATGPSQLPTP